MHDTDNDQVEPATPGGSEDLSEMSESEQRDLKLSDKAEVMHTCDLERDVCICHFTNNLAFQ